MDFKRLSAPKWLFIQALEALRIIFQCLEFSVYRAEVVGFSGAGNTKSSRMPLEPESIPQATSSIVTCEGT
jgi:hypothetical protein